MNTLDKIWPRIKTTEDCWHWLLGHDKEGYPIVTIERRQYRVHRLIYAVLVGSVKGQVVAHTCNNKWCVRPDHLQAMSAADNSTAAMKDGLYKTKLSAEAVHEIRTTTVPLHSLATKHNISYSYVCKLRYGQRKRDDCA